MWDLIDFGSFAQSLFNFFQMPTLGNGIDVVLNGVGLAPGVPALGTIKRVAEMGDNAKNLAFSAEQAANIKRFEKKIPSNAKDSVELHELPNSGVAVQATSPGNVPGSKAVYEKQIDVNGQTIQATKTTYDPQGNIVHVKDKLNGGTYP